MAAFYVRHDMTMKTVLLLLVTSVAFAETAWGAMSIRQHEATFPGGTVQFFLRGTNLIYERVLYSVPQPTDVARTNWVERFYYRGQLVFQRCSAIEQICTTTLPVPGIGVYQGSSTSSDGVISPRLQIGELDKGSPTLEAGTWIYPFELFSLAADGFYYPKDVGAHPVILSSYIWLTDDPGSSTSIEEIQRLRSRVLKAASGEPDGAANAASPPR